MTAEFLLTLHTKVGLLLFNGNWRFGRMGLVQFASLTTILWRAFKEDDPYAELYLLKIYEAIEETKKKLKDYELLFQNQLKNLRGFEIDIFKNPAPLKQPLRFGTPFSYMAAMLIEQVDYVNRQLFTLNRMGLIPEENLVTNDLIREIQKVFRLPRAWRYTGVTRKDIIEKNQKAQQAQELLGEIPTTVLNNEITFRFLPKPKCANLKTKTRTLIQILFVI